MASSANNLPSLYFSAADGGIDYLIRDRDFDASLIYNLLFEKTGLVLSDVSFFNCVPLRKHMDGTQKHFFIDALRRGLIIPAFRDADTETFEEALSAIGGYQVHGIEREGFDALDLAQKLDNAVKEKGVELNRRVWPDNMGGYFETVLRSVVEREERGTGNSRQEKLWSSTKTLRLQAIGDAREKTVERGGLGIRRAEIWNAIGWNLGVLNRSDSFDRPGELVRRVTDLRDRRLAQQVRFVVDVVNLCYQRSQASQFEAYQNVPAPLTRHLRAVLPAIDRASAYDFPTRFETKVWLPSPAAVMGADSGDMLEVQDSNVGDAFFESRKLWAADPNEDTENALKEATGAYSKKLMSVAAAANKGTPAAIAVNIARTAVAPQVATASVALTTNDLPVQYKLVASALAGAAVTTVNIIKAPSGVWPQRREVKFHTPAELNIPPH